MKMSKKIAVYITLICTLVLCIAGAVVLGMNIFLNKTPIMSDLQSKTKEDVFNWANKNKVSDFITYEYAYSADIEEGYVISQSLEPNEKVTDNFTVTISKGSIISLNITEYNTKKDFSNFIVEYPNVKVTYEGDDSESAKIEKFSKNSIDIKNDSLTVYLEIKEVPDTIKNEDNKNDKKEDDKNEDDSKTKVLIPNDLLGIKEEDFIKKLNDLGFKNLKKSETKYYSFTSKKDMIFSYDDGKYEIDRTINYAISLGDYPSTFNGDDFNGKSLKDANEVVKKYNELNAHITLKTNDVQTSDSKLVNKLSNCKCLKEGTKSIITCDLNTKEEVPVNIESYAGQSESDFLSKLKAKGFNNFNKTSKYSSTTSGYIVSNDTGSKKTSETINYVVSLGLYKFNDSEFNGNTVANANTLVSNYNSKGANIEFKYQEYETTDYSNGILYDCSSSSSSKTIITCKLAKQIVKYSVPSEAVIKQHYSTNTYDGTVAKLKELFDGKFTNVKYNPVESTLGLGQIVNVTVDGNNEYNAGDYVNTTSIVIDICSSQRG